MIKAKDAVLFGQVLFRILDAIEEAERRPSTYRLQPSEN
jgi:hypothetical protein